MNNQATKMKTRHQAAFTLVEMLIAMALTLILVYAIAEFYAYVGNAVRDGRATIEMSGQLRAASQQLNDDLQSLTLRPRAWIDPHVSPGYFSVYEGPGYDADPDFNGISTNSLYDDSNSNKVADLVENNSVTTLFGDGDDILAFTIRAKDTPFRGRYNGGIISSPYAEVIWFTTFVDSNGDGNWNIGETRFLCRKLLLIVPNLTFTSLTYNSAENVFDFWESNDVSVHFEAVSSGSSTVKPVANSLENLSKRENRFGCRVKANAPKGDSTVAVFTNHPFVMDINPNNAANLTMYTLQGTGYGEDRVLTNVLAFDVRVWDPGAPVYKDADSTTTVVPGDPGFVATANAAAMNTNLLQGYGAWVDLYFNLGITSRESGTAVNSYFSGAPATTTNNTGPDFVNGLWDTWPTTYENDGVNQDGNTPSWRATSDTSVNGLDDDGQNGVDDPGERETQPPYSTQLRGIQVRIRIYEPQTRQMRQVTVGADFVE